MDRMKDLKDAIIYTVNTTKNENPVSLFTELLHLLYARGFSDGQDYLCDEHGYVKIIRCKDCKHYDEETGRCALLHVHGCAETWFCADGKRR